jgi:hypothetical protein
MKPLSNGIVIDAPPPSGFGQMHPLSIKNDEAIVASVFVLIPPRSPAAIPRLVVAVHVLALEAKSRPGALAHVLVESGEVEPSLANCDPSAAIVSVIAVGCPSTPSLH